MKSGMNGIASWPPTMLANVAIQITYRLRRQPSVIAGGGYHGSKRAVRTRPVPSGRCSNRFAGRPERPYTRVRRDHASTDGYGTTDGRDGGVERRTGRRRASGSATVA